MLKVETAAPEGLLGDVEITADPLPGAADALKNLDSKLKLGAAKRTRAVEQALLSQIQAAPREAFLLPAVLDFLSSCKERGLLPEAYTFNHFELFLNQQAGLSEGENSLIRAKIVGKLLPREEYQVYFPIGAGRVHPGSHYVTAHAPPDIDTAVASFWGWVEAFGARVAENLHIWNLPGGIPSPAIQRAFAPLFGPSLFALLPRSSASLDICAIDLATQKGLELKGGEVATRDLDHQRTKKLIALVDREGFYLGSWRASDVEGFRLVAVLVGQLFQWFASTVAIQLTSLFAQPVVERSELLTFFRSLLEMKLAVATPLRELGEGQRSLLQRTLEEILGIKGGLEATLGEFVAPLRPTFDAEGLLKDLENSPLFDAKGRLIEDRPLLFSRLSHVIQGLSSALEAQRAHFDRLSVALDVKHRVFGQALQYAPSRASLAEIREAIGDHHFLIVAEEAEGERLIPLGLIEGSELHHKILGTVSLRDFCNRDEVKIPDYLEIISVVDHHRTSLETHSFPTAILGDAQSCNVLLAEQAFLQNDRYASGLQPGEGGSGPAALRARQRAITRELAAASRGNHYLHPKREFAEYLGFLYAILDDTDLLDRVTARDVTCVAELLNRLKSLSLGRDVEVIHFDDIPRDRDFPKRAAQRLLQNHELYSLYRKVFERRKMEVERDLARMAGGESSEAFADTKEQKGCARVGQTKIFADNYRAFARVADKLRAAWLKAASQAQRDQPTLDLHLQMISTMVGAEEVYQGVSDPYTHQDELWVWVPNTEAGRSRLASYLSLFKKAPEIAGGKLTIEIVGEETKPFEQLLSYHFKGGKVKRRAGEGPIIIFRYPAGTITSRKTSITPYLPG
ncbi:MAG: hypothetical protein AB7F31_05455 [Parachlamydiales bacterium]